MMNFDYVQLSGYFAAAVFAALWVSARGACRRAERFHTLRASISDDLSASLERALNKSRHEREAVQEELKSTTAMFNRLAKTLDAKQAKIDSLMLEFCPDEMTEEQKAEWASHRRPAPIELQRAIDAAAKTLASVPPQILAKMREAVIAPNTNFKHKPWVQVSRLAPFIELPPRRFYDGFEVTALDPASCQIPTAEMPRDGAGLIEGRNCPVCAKRSYCKIFTGDDIRPCIGFSPEAKR